MRHRHAARLNLLEDGIVATGNPLAGLVDVFTPCLDGVIYIKKGAKYYQREIGSYINVKWFGAKCDGVTDDTVPLKKAIELSNVLKLSLILPYESIIKTSENIEFK